MPIYPVTHECGFSGEAYAKIAERHAIACPRCGKGACDIDFARVLPATTARTYAGASHAGTPATLCLTEGFNPSEVVKAREVMGERFGSCIKANGEVHFADRTERDGWFARKREVRKRSRK